MGNTAIPSALGTTVTGAIANLANLGNKVSVDLLKSIATNGTFSLAHPITDYSLILLIPSDASTKNMHESITAPTDYIKNNYGKYFMLNSYNAGVPYVYIIFNNASSINVECNGYAGYIYGIK